jgi:hypothetical protein
MLRYAEDEIREIAVSITTAVTTTVQQPHNNKEGYEQYQPELPCR